MADADALSDSMIPEDDDPFTTGGLITDGLDIDDLHRLTANDITTQVTQRFLAGLDPTLSYDPADIERDLLDAVNTTIAAANDGRPRSGQLPWLKRMTFGQIADTMLITHHICRIGPSNKNTDRDQDMLAIYEDSGENKGIYTASEDVFRTIARRFDYSLTTKDFAEVLSVLRDKAPRRYQCQNRDLIAVNNGIYNYATDELQPFTPDIVFLSKSQVDYNDTIENPQITMPDGVIWDVESWMQTLSDDPEIVDLLWQILGAIIRPHVRWNKSAWLYSKQGNNGKGTLCELMRQLTGPNSYASIALGDFAKEFHLEPLIRASAVIVDENDVGAYIDRAANLKAVITNDVILINRKNKTPISYQFHGFMVQCLNEFPRIKDKTETFYRRQLFIPMTKNFKGIERTYIKTDYLHRDDVLQYVLKKVLHDLPKYYKLSEPQAVLETLDEYREFNDPVRGFFTEMEQQFSWDLLPFNFLYDLYRSWFALNNASGKIIGRNKFIEEIIPIAIDTGRWYLPGGTKDSKTRSQPRMNKPELLIDEYNLKNWMNLTYTGTDKIKRVDFNRSTHYRGIVRVTTTTQNTTP